MKNNTPPWFKVLALCTALGLGGTYVWRQQQRAVPQINRTIESPVLPDSVNKDTPVPPVEPKKTNRILLSGSKSSSGVFKPEINKEPILMPSSKIGIIQLKAEDTKDRILLPGSKSFQMPVFRERRLAPEDQPKPDKP